MYGLAFSAGSLGTLMKMNFKAAAVAIMLGAMSTSAAQASILFDFSFSGAGISGSGTFTTGDVGSPYTVTAISGTVNGDSITGLSSYAAADNLLYFPAGPYVDFSGISFSTVSSGDFGLGWTGSAYGIANSLTNPSGACCGINPLTFSVTEVPEPAVWSLFLLGFAGIGWMLRDNRRWKSA